ncbi:hypothetical protein [Paraburkholderia humisilvae]|uniref:DUF2147 domain-containing protein n=1 Tax=Paraburkholderia humisilvae TaxID=627669 RepID=A0A6J5CXI5_9BURK|nr:hypothetical protein [Paraburkholderia humisilvae]CAB3745877.1 hypothetical protein LMG29542_00066 [Paraburkholderia humisilvae]
MKRFAPVFALTLACSTICHPALAAESPESFAGVWSCNGIDEHAGKFTERVAVRLVPGYHDAHSVSFDVDATIEENAKYRGVGMVSGGVIVSDFISTADQTDHGVLIGKFERGTPLRVNARYFETQQSKPSRGTEICTRTGD